MFRFGFISSATFTVAAAPVIIRLVAKILPGSRFQQAWEALTTVSMSLIGGAAACAFDGD